MKFQLTFSLCVFYHIIFADTCIFSDINVICVCVCVMSVGVFYIWDH